MSLDKPEDLTILEKSLAPVLLCWYASIGDVDSLKELINLGVDINLQDYDNRSAIHLAAGENQFKILELLFIHNAQLKHDIKGETAMYDAIRADSLKTIKLLRAKYGAADITRISPQELATEMCIAVAMNDITKI